MIKSEYEVLWKKFKDSKDSKARELLILEYVGLVKYVAGRMAISLPSNIQYEDLLSYGIFGLIDAIEKFDVERNIKFETYAIARIRGAILDGLRSMDWVPHSLRNKAKELERIFAKLELKLGRSATDVEVCEELGISRQQLSQLLIDTSFLTILSLDDLWMVDGDGSNPIKVIDTIKDDKAVDPVETVEYKERKKILSDAIYKLPERERLVITLYYYEGLTLKEIGKVMGVSESRISQMHTKAIMRLRGHLSRLKNKIVD